MIFVIKSCSRNKQLPPLLTVAGQITNINLNVTPTIIDCKLSLVIDNEMSGHVYLLIPVISWI